MVPAMHEGMVNAASRLCPFAKVNFESPGPVLIDQLQVEKSFVLFLKTIVFNALIPNILPSRLSDEQKCIFSHLKSADFETVCDWSTSS